MCLQLTGLVTSCVETVSWNTVLKGRWRGGEEEEEDERGYWMTLRKRDETETLDRTVWGIHFGRSYGPAVR